MKLLHSMMDILDESTEDIIRDPTSLDASTFVFINGYFKHILTQKEKERPYMLSYIYYGTVAYEHLILLINKVVDVWELPVGTQLKIPKLEDIRTWIKENVS